MWVFPLLQDGVIWPTCAPKDPTEIPIDLIYVWRLMALDNDWRAQR
jgi:hypothetical protein